VKFSKKSVDTNGGSNYIPLTLMNSHRTRTGSGTVEGVYSAESGQGRDLISSISATI
jgi:hypothetical protein